MCVSLTNIKKLPCTVTNPGGNLRLMLIGEEDLIQPLEVQDPLTGKYSITPASLLAALAPGKMFAEFEFSKDACEGKYEAQGEPDNRSFKHSVTADIAGYSKTIEDALMQFAHQQVVAILKHRDKLLVQYGSKEQPLEVKFSGTTGKKAGDKRANMFTFEIEGLPFIPITIPAASVVPVLP